MTPVVQLVAEATVPWGTIRVTVRGVRPLSADERAARLAILGEETTAWAVQKRDVGPDGKFFVAAVVARMALPGVSSTVVELLPKG